ncbi:MAG: hypothetical protein ACE5G8_04940 [Anaerolineae bacterium]
MDYTLAEWLALEATDVAKIVSRRAPTAVIYLNGTRRWFLSRQQNWANYARVTGRAQRKLSDLFFEHGLQTLIQPLLGYDLLHRGPDYLTLAVEQGLGELTSPAYRNWFAGVQARVTFYGNWQHALTEHGFAGVAAALQDVIAETAPYTRRRLLFGLFADHAAGQIVRLAQSAGTGSDLLTRYYGQPAGPVDLVVGSGQPAIWDLPLLDVNRASLYFLQAPTFCLGQPDLRRILYDHLFERVDDDRLYDRVSDEGWDTIKILGIGRRTDQGWIAR